MRKSVRLGAVATGLALVLAPVAAHADTVVLDLSGKGSWSISCNWTDSRDRQKTRQENGRGTMSTASLVLKDLVVGSCTVETDDRAELQIVGDAMGSRSMCPFEKMDAEGRCGFKVGPNANYEVALNSQ
ncbi:MAG: hypothetical protein ACFB22_03715 [Rhodothalassiaceae bacterium]